MERALQEVEEPEEIRLREALPDVATAVHNSRQIVVRTVEGYGNTNERLLQDIIRSQKTLYQRQEETLRFQRDFHSGKFGVTIHSNQVTPLMPEQYRIRRNNTLQGPAPISTPSTTVERCRSQLRMDSNNRTSVEIYQVRDELESIDPVLIGIDQDRNHTEQQEVLAEEQAPTLVQSQYDRTRLDPSSPPNFKMSRYTITVPDLWREWTVGLGPNSPPVKDLEELYGPKWRPESSERMWFSRRKPIIDLIKQYNDPITTANKLEDIRVEKNLNLQNLSALIRSPGFSL